MICICRGRLVFREVKSLTLGYSSNNEQSQNLCPDCTSSSLVLIHSAISFAHACTKRLPSLLIQPHKRKEDKMLCYIKLISNWREIKWDPPRKLWLLLPEWTACWYDTSSCFQWLVCDLLPQYEYGFECLNAKGVSLDWQCELIFSH